MRFRSTRPQTPWLSSRYQWRMLRLIGLLAFVLIAINFAARPQTWRWLFPDEGQQAGAERVPRMKDVDLSVRLSDGPLPDGVFRVQAAQDPDVIEAPQPDEEEDDCQTALRRDLFRNIEDRTLGIAPEEAEAFYAVLAKAASVSPECLRNEAQKVPFTVLMTHLDEYRGEILSIEGTLRKLSTVTAGENGAGIEEYHEAWLTTADSDDKLYRVVLARAPEGVSPGEWTSREDGEIRVRLAGYFFKAQGYATRGGEGLTVAPLVIAPNLVVRQMPRTEAAAAAPPVLGYVIGGAVALAALLAGAIWWYSRGDRQFEEQVLSRYAETPPESLDALRGVSTNDPDEFIRRLGEEPKGM